MLDLIKPVQTRNGLRARIVSTDLSGTYPIGAIITYEDGREGFESYTKSGAFGIEPHDMDLCNTPEGKVQFCNQFADGSLGTMCDYPPADSRSRATHRRIAILRVFTQLKPTILPPVFTVHEGDQELIPA